MIAKEIAMPRRGGSFRGLVAYLTSSRGKAERVGRVQLTNCVSADVASAVLEVEATQGRNYRARHRTYHLMLSFREDLAADVLEQIEQRACAALGFEAHQRVSVVHHDTDHVHVHIAINRVNPSTHAAHWPSYSKFALDRLCVELERQHGLLPDRHLTRERGPLLEAAEQLRQSLQRDAAEGLRKAGSWLELHEVAAVHGLRVELRGNGLALVTGDDLRIRASSVDRALSRAALERRLGAFEPGARFPLPAKVEQAEPVLRRPPDIERVAGVERLIGWVQRTCAAELEQSNSWPELHEAARTHGLRVQLRGNGLVFVGSGGSAIKGSSVSRGLSKVALERRLGAFQEMEGPVRELRNKYEPVPLAGVSDPGLYAQYREEREATFERRARLVMELRNQRAHDAERIRQVSKRRWAAIRFVAKGRVAWALWRSYAKQADRRDRERARERHRAALRTLAADQRRVGWVDWLRQRASENDAGALAILRAQRHGGQPGRDAISGDARTRDSLSAAVDSVTAAGTVIYRVAGATIRDDGKRLQLADSQRSQLAAEALVRLAYERYGVGLGVDGDDAFRDRIVRAAVNAALPVTFADEGLERRRLELERIQRKEPADADERRGRPGQRPGTARTIPRAPAAAARSGLPEPNARDGRREAPARSVADLRGVSSIPLVRFGGAPAVLLPPDARHHVDERNPQTDPAVRRPDPQYPVVSRRKGR